MKSQIRYTEVSKKEVKLKVLYWRLCNSYSIEAGPGRLFCLCCFPGTLDRCEGQDLEFKLVDEKGEAVFSGKALVESMDLVPWCDETIGMVVGILVGPVAAEDIKENSR